MKKVSVVTINFNNRNGLAKTMESVFAQTSKDYEYIVIDGASTDGSVDVIRSFSDKNFLWVSEPDTGIYNAMNKGIDKASGEYILFLNSGDCFAGTNVIKNAVCEMDGVADFLSGDMLYTDDRLGLKVPPELATPYYMMGNFLPHPSTFIKTRLLKNRHYREDLKIVSDWEQMFYELVCRDAKYKKLDFLVSIFDASGVSSNEDKSEQLMERHKAIDAQLSQQVQIAVLPNGGPIIPYMMEGKYEKRILRALQMSKPLKRDAKIFRQAVKMFFRDVLFMIFPHSSSANEK